MPSLQDLPLRNPAFSLRISFSRVSVKSSTMILLNNLLVRLKRVIPHQLLEPERSCSFLTLTTSKELLYDLTEHFACASQESYTPTVVTIRQISLFWKPQDQTGLPVFKHVFGYPDFPEKLRKDRESQRFFWQYKISTDAVCTRRFTIFHLADGFIDFINSRWISAYVDTLCVGKELCCFFRFRSGKDTLEMLFPASKLSSTQIKTLPFSSSSGLSDQRYGIDTIVA